MPSVAQRTLGANTRCMGFLAELIGTLVSWFSDFDSGHQKILVRGHSFPAGGQFDSRSTDTSLPTVTAQPARRRVLPRRFRCSARKRPCAPGRLATG